MILDGAPTGEQLTAVERALRASGIVADAAVVLREDGAGAPHVVAFYVSSNGIARDRDDLSAAIAAGTDGAVVPEHFVALERLPRRDDGDVDRSALRLSPRAERLLANAAPIPVHDGPAPLTVNQELIWMLDRTAPADPAYNAASMMRLAGPLDRTALQRSIDAIVERQAVLRTTVAGEGASAVQVVHPAGAVPIEIVDVTATAAGQSRDAVERLASERLARGFDLEREPPFRATLIALGPEEHMLLWVTHHLFMDDTSISLFWREFTALYDAFARGVPSRLRPPGASFADFAAWQRANVTEERLAPQLAYWREHLRGAPQRLALPREPSPRASGFTGGQATRVIDVGLLRRISRLADARGTTVYVVLTAALAALLARYTGLDDVIVGSPTSGRTHRSIEDVLGYFVNTLPRRHDVSGDPSFGALVDRIAASTRESLRNQDVPLEMLTSSLERDGGAPQMQCVLTMRVNPKLPGTAGGLAVERPWLDSLTAGFSKFDLVVLATKEPDHVLLVFQYRTDAFTASTVARMADHFTALLEAGVSDPALRVSDLRLGASSDEGRLESTAAAVTHDGVSTVVDRFAAAARRTPHAVAVRCGDDAITYDELDARSSTLAARLGEAGARRGTCVGLCVDRSIAMVAGMLAVMKSGAAYVPLPPDQPRARLAAQIERAEVRLVLADAASRAALPAGVRIVGTDVDVAVPTPPASAGTAPNPDDIAYVLFTSGSTGVPKGVAVTHRNLLQYARAIAQRLGVRDDDPWHFAAVSTFAADLGYTAIFPALCSGGVLHVVPDAIATDAARFAAYVASHPIDVLKITPSHFAALLRDDPARITPRRCVVFGGEPLPWALVARLSGCRVVNHYGPTETTVGACTFVVGEDLLGDARPATVPSGTRGYVVDARGELQADGVPGELLIGGAGVARGYVGEPALTAQRFVADRFSGEHAARLYRTGDRVRRLPSGDLEFLGRLDDQVKIRGFRVELGEIEAALRAQPNVANAAVVCDERDGDARLIAYVTPAANQPPPDAAAVRAALAARLPDVMVPAPLVVLDRLPLTANGKVDRAALPRPDALERERPYAAPRSATEAQLCAIWSDVLKIERVGIADDFLALGGHSILAIRVLGKVSAQFGVRLPLKALFDAATPERLAATIDDHARVQHEHELERILRSLDGLSDDDVARLDARREAQRS